jgi:DNA-binding transcriptional LysR family regulator
MLYDYLAEFETVCRMGSLARAATALSISQPTLSRHMDSLERDLGVTLLNRTEHGCSPTEIGRAVFDKAVDITEAGDAIESLVQAASAQDRHRSPQAGARNLVFVGDIALASLSGAIRSCVEKTGSGSHQIAFRPTPTDADFTLERLLLGTDEPHADAVLLFRADAHLENPAPGISVIDVWAEPFYVAMRPDHPLAKLESVSMDDLKNQTFIFPHGDYLNSFSGWEEFKRICKLHGFMPRSVGKPFDNVGDFYSWEIGNELSPINRSTPIAAAFFNGDYRCIPVSDELYPHLSAAYRTDDKLVEKVLRNTASACKDMLHGKGQKQGD